MNTLLEIGLSNAVVAALLALPVAGLAAVCRRPALAHSLWLLVLLKLVTPPLVLIPLPWPVSGGPLAAAREVLSADSNSPSVPPSGGATAGEPAPDSLPDPEERDDLVPLLPEEADLVPDRVDAEDSPPPAGPAPGLLDAERWIVPLWLGTSLLWFAWTGWHLLRFRRLLGVAWAAPVVLQRQADDLAARLGLRRAPGVWLVPGTVSPMVW